MRRCVGLDAALMLALVFVVTSCATRQRGAAAPVDVATAWTLDRCVDAIVDRDLDGVDDRCELDLARAFAPALVVDRSDCSWDGRRLAGGYFYAVGSRPQHRTIRIAYLPAYFRDCGWTGPPCVTRGRGCSAHAGDSELIAVEVRPQGDAGQWRTQGIFLSAHCLGRSAGRCRWYRDSQLSHFTWTAGSRGAAHVWVARGKHATYPSARECDSGHWYYDTCDTHDVMYRFPIVSGAQNVGSRVRPLPDRGERQGCAIAEQLPIGNSGADAGTIECFWDAAARFRGWQRDAADGATPYSRVLAAAGF